MNRKEIIDLELATATLPYTDAGYRARAAPVVGQGFIPAVSRA